MIISQPKDIYQSWIFKLGATFSVPSLKADQRIAIFKRKMAMVHQKHPSARWQYSLFTGICSCIGGGIGGSSHLPLPVGRVSSVSGSSLPFFF